MTVGSRVNGEECVSTFGGQPVCRVLSVRKVNAGAMDISAANRHPDYYPSLQSIIIAEGVDSDEFNYYIPAEFESAF